MAGRGRGRGLGRGRGAPAIQEVPPLSEENRQKLIKDGATKETVKGQFEDSTINDVTNTQTNNMTTSTTEVDNKPQTTPNKDPKQNGLSNDPAGRSKSSPAQLNPNSLEFVPQFSTSKLNAFAAEFVPKSYDQVPPPSLDPEYGEDLTVLDILEGFNRRSSIEDPLLMEVADMLVTATEFPATFDEKLLELSETINGIKMISDEVLIDIGEMLIQWGITDTALRCTAVRISDYMCKVEELESRFRKPFFTHLQKLFEEEQDRSDRSEEEVSRLMEFSLFIAEMFYRVRVGKDEVVWVLGYAVVELMFILVELKQDKTVKCACNIIKLTGYLLENKTAKNQSFDPVKKMDTLITSLKYLCNDSSLSKRVCEVIINVLQFRGKKYDRAIEEKPVQKGAEAIETPVRHEEEWSEYVDEAGNVIEGYDDFEHYYNSDDADPDPNIDDEIMRGYEEFLHDFEEHLLHQEFGHYRN